LLARCSISFQKDGSYLGVTMGTFSADDITPTDETIEELKVIMASYDDPALDREYSSHPGEVLTFVEACRQLGKAHTEHSPDEHRLQRISNELEDRFGLPRPVSHEIRRHCHA
jgi:hypothetical protein